MNEQIERSYSVAEVAEKLKVTRQTIYKYLSLDEPKYAQIPVSGWYRLPGGHLRIKESALKELQTSLP